MPIIDDERGLVVLRLVYDGPPLAGKTTTLRTLAEGLGVGLVTPAERDGRTLFFDWVDYVGGLFDGRRIRCQIVSVPGQPELAERRRVLLESADAVVFVSDTRRGELEASVPLLRDVVRWSRSERPPVGLVLQANKRDAPDRLPLTSIRQAIEPLGPIAITETVASDGEGVREAFVFAVRLALDRVRALADAGGLRVGPPEVDDPAALLAQLEQMEAESSSASPAPGPVMERRADGAVSPGEPAPPLDTAVASPAAGTPAPGDPEAEIPFRPDPAMPGGYLWPPVDGRALLHEVSQLGLTPDRAPEGDWAASGGGWRVHSRQDALFPTSDLGRAALIDWARLHAAGLRRLSSGRILILAEAGGGRHRLWQVVRVHRTLRERLGEAARLASPRDLARELRVVARLLARAHEASADSHPSLPCSLWTIGAEARATPAFVGLMPAAHEDPPPPVATSAVLGRELAPVLARIRAEREDFERVVSGLEDALRAGSPDPIGEALASLARAALEPGSPERPAPSASG